MRVDGSNGGELLRVCLRLRLERVLYLMSYNCMRIVLFLEWDFWECL
jgi:hypothetical protein